MNCGCNKCDLCKEKSMDKKKAKLSQLKDLSKEMSKMMGDGYADSMQKVTVASDSKEGLEKGLSKAQELMKKKGLMSEMSDEEKEYEEDIDDSEEEELEEDLEEMADDVDKMSPEEMKMKIKELEAKLADME
jgi:hypothetical protein